MGIGRGQVSKAPVTLPAQGRAVFFDRDGVLNRAVVRNNRPYPPAGLDQLEIEPDAPGAVARLRTLGLRLLVVTNQPDVARGTQQKEQVEAINAYLLKELALDRIYTCYHDDQAGCHCRKPLPGMLEQGAREWGVDLSRSFLIGDRYKDIEAGRRAGCLSILINRGYAEAPTAVPDYTVNSLEQAAAIISDIIAQEDR